jgi:hypothetical protein
MPMSYWTYIEHPLHYIRFNDETTYRSIFGKIVLIFQTSTIINPVQIDGVSYNCTIVGDGDNHHFGRNFPGEDPATIKLACQSLTSNMDQKELPMIE